jgi:23S rRNA pseudouridine1911/1915/1917 synthase
VSEARSLVLSPTRSGPRLDQYLAEQIEGISRTRARDLILSGSVRVDGRLARPSYHVQTAEEIRVDLPAVAPSALVPEDLPLTVVYEDEDMAVLDKPAGIAVHPSPGHREHTLVHGLLGRYPDLPGINGTQRPGIVHRLDLNTSGLLMVAKTDRGMASLSGQIEARRVKKGYLALLKGALDAKRGVIEAPIARDPAHRQQMAIVAGGRDARTRFVELDELAGHALVIAMPETGRTHQLRVHFASTGHAIAGDPLYGGRVSFLRRQFLHAMLLRFARPSDGATVELQAPLPADLTEALRHVLRAGGASPSEVDRRIVQMLRLSEKHFRNELM